LQVTETRKVNRDDHIMRALPRWKQAHAQMLHSLGEQQVDTLRANLAAVVALSQYPHLLLSMYI